MEVFQVGASHRPARRLLAAIILIAATVSAGGGAESQVQIQYQGRSYQTRYESGTGDNNTPIDLYFFRILTPEGQQAVQDGQQLWGRFVRVPAANAQGQVAHQHGEIGGGKFIYTPPPVTWWLATWEFRNGQWLDRHLRDIKIDQEPVRR